MSNDDSGLNSSVADAAAGVDNTQSTDQQPSSGGHPAWQEVLEVLPTSLHSQVTPLFQKWDQGVSERFQKVQSDYAPYKSFIDSGVSPEQLQAAQALMQMVESNPREFYDRMGAYYAQEWGLDQGQGSDDADDSYSLDDLDDDGQDSIDVENNPYIQQIKQQQDTMAQLLVTQYEQQQAAAAEQAAREADAEVAQVMDSITDKYGELSKDQAEIIFGIAMQDPKNDLAAAADRFFAVAGNQPQRRVPTIVSPGGGVPTQNVDVANLSGPDRRATVAEILRQAAEANKQ